VKHKNAKSAFSVKLFQYVFPVFFDAENPKTVKTCLEQKEEKFD
jgi:hypothetical protein